AGLDRDRAFYPTITIVIASYYALFAVMGGRSALTHESIVMAGFVLLSVIAFKRNLFLLVVALVAHGLFDFVHGTLISNPGVPLWWPPFCLAYAVVTSAYLSLPLWIRPRLATAARSAFRSAPSTPPSTTWPC